MKLIDVGYNDIDYDKVGNDDQSCILAVVAIILAISILII